MFNELDFSLQLELDSLTKSELGANGKHFGDTDVMDWALDFTSIQFMAPGERLDPLHFDGGASAFGMILTLWGDNRKTVFFNQDGSVIANTSVAGTLYTAGFCQAQHQVSHPPAGSLGDLLETKAGPVSVVCLFRSRVFRKARGTGTKGPTPKKVGNIVLDLFREAMVDNRFQIPNIEECQAAVTMGESLDGAPCERCRRVQG